ncbi:MAG: heavy-metal-associated domain-containing protein [Candidatus Marinimicrobia bacterium]|jgi:copper chaperone CopZ|nr:heavy-metal-associated domain-containing protein [Candidatus Neomarinimicrobiota bacterium]|tara:strand:- start:566 stop:895 length:330 start_codon:yes stop_codon:yes gene_type:complete
MKSIISIIAISFLISCNSDTKTAELKLGSMQCMMCSMTVEETVADLNGVSKIVVDLKGKSGKVTYKASLIDLPTIEKAITSIGYSVNDKEADPDAYANLELCCKIPEGQ